MADVLEIRMQRFGVTCYLCGIDTEEHWGVPVLNGDVVSNDFPDWLWRQGGGGQAVCEDCYDKHARGEVPTFDKRYLHLDGSFTQGAGI